MRPQPVIGRRPIIVQVMGPGPVTLASMARWQPAPAQRLSAAALDLFIEQGYENTTIPQIAERAGLTKSTFFRHFPDKREVLFGDGALSQLLHDAIVDASPAASPLQAVAAGLDVLGVLTFTADIRTSSSRRQAVIAAHTELREREALKATGLVAAMTAALQERGIGGLTASLAAELGALAMKITLERWIDPANTEDFNNIAHRTLQEIRTATTALR